MQKIKPCLWFDDRIEEAVKLYTGLFRNSRILETSHYPDGRVLVIVFEIDGEEVMALNGGPDFKFTEAVSLFVDCADQAEVDRYWTALTANGGQESMCGWL
jgi:predicted 3-demethylubiquinone-9 3-methyltransferase (glyoxalase superfamily)